MHNDKKPTQKEKLLSRVYGSEWLHLCTDNCKNTYYEVLFGLTGFKIM